jgi:SAM-dependent methyltransferase
MDREAHWNRVYETKRPDAVSWYQPSPRTSLAYIQKLTRVSQRVMDVGGGASVLVDALLDAGYERPVVLDVSASGLGHAKKRLGPRAALVEWLVADVTQAPELPLVDLWHDRAVLHFLTAPADQATYAAVATRTVRPAGHVVLGTFAPDGPEKCSGLAVQRHDGASVARLLGSDFDLLEQDSELHVTPVGTEQRFSWAVLRRR